MIFVAIQNNSKVYWPVLQYYVGKYAYVETFYI